jgi:hypothetical protein
MFRNGLVGAALAVLSLSSVAMADGSGAAGAPQAIQTQFVEPPMDLASLSQNPVVFADDQTPAPAPAPTPGAAPGAAAAAPGGAAAAEAAPATPAPPQGAIMAGLDAIGIGKEMEKLGLSITGFIEGGYFYDFTVPHNTAPPRSTPPTFILFPGNYKNQVMLNQLDLQIARSVDSTKFDVGFMVEMMYGRDAVYIHSNGLLDNGNKHGNTSPDDDFDLTQAYLTVNIPVGNGLLLTGGKFVSPFGYEYINPTQNQLYTHSYLFSYAIPFTQTGITGAYKINDSLTAMAGITRGWNQSTSDNNGAIDFLGELTWTMNSKMGFVANLSVGPQSSGNNSDYWTVVEGVYNWQISDQLKLGVDAVYGNANAIAQWYGIAGYLNYQFNKYFAGNFRAEYYHDGRGFTTGVGGTDINFCEGTLGCAITPTPDVPLLQTLTIRPEVRIDAADHAVYDGTHFNQTTAAIDVFIKF